MVKRKPIIEVLKILGLIAICLLAGVIGGLFTSTGPTSWYAQLHKPSFNPPNWIFAPVWTTLYILMGVSLYLALRNKVERKGIILFISQLIFNTLWTIIFFGLQNTLLALIEIIILLILILWTIISFHKKSKTAAYLLIPYLLWVTFAALLNLAIVILN